MELEELKSAWAELDTQLKENKSLSEKIIMEMAQNKVDKLISRFINHEMLGMSILILLIPFIVFSYYRHGGRWMMWDILVIYCGIVCVVFPVWSVFRLLLLFKIDFSKKISSIIYFTNRYNISNKRGMIAAYFIGPSFIILGVLTYVEAHANIYLWVFFVSVMLVCIILSFWAIKKYDKNIIAIMKSLNEIKALQEEE